MKENTVLKIATAWKLWTPEHSVEPAFWNLKQGLSFGISGPFTWHHCPYRLRSVYIQFAKLH